MVHGEKKDDGHADTSKLAVLGCFFVSPTRNRPFSLVTEAADRNPGARDKHMCSALRTWSGRTLGGHLRSHA